MNINDLPIDCLLIILEQVPIAFFDNEGTSTLSNLTKCSTCFEKDIEKNVGKDVGKNAGKDVKCTHLHEKEVLGIKCLKIVCKKWCYIIKKFEFTSGKNIILPPNY